MLRGEEGEKFQLNRHTVIPNFAKHAWKTYWNTIEEAIGICSWNIRYPCDKCDKSFDQEHNLPRHIHSKHEKIRYLCDKCHKLFYLEDNLQRHIQSKHWNHENQVRIDDYVRRGRVHDSENQVAIDDDVKRGRGWKVSIK